MWALIFNINLYYRNEWEGVEGIAGEPLPRLPNYSDKQGSTGR